MTRIILPCHVMRDVSNLIRVLSSLGDNFVIYGWALTSPNSAICTLHQLLDLFQNLKRILSFLPGP